MSGVLDAFRGVAKRCVEVALVRSGAAGIGRLLSRRRTLVLAYHNVLPDGVPGQGDRSLHLPLGAFRAQIDAIARTHDIIPLADVLMPAAAATRPRVAITFDDAYRGAVSAGMPELVRRRLPATVFVAPGLLGRQSFWWDMLADPERGLDPALRHHALGALRGQQEAVVGWARAAGHRLHAVDEWLTSATEDEVTALAREPGITVGSHSWSHPNLATLDGDELVQELAPPLAWIRERCPAAAIPWLSYPYGATSGLVAGLARDAGYQGALLVAGGWIAAPHARPFAVPRINIPAAMSLDGFTLRAAGMLTGEATATAGAASPAST